MRRLAETLKADRFAKKAKRMRSQDNWSEN
jgi:hypothetical protein